MRKYFIMDFYKHHKISIIFIILICSGLLLAASFIPNTTFGENSGNAYQNIKTQLGSYFYSILFIFIFIILSYIYAFSRVYSKILMQIKFISPYKIILTIGIIGFIISILASIVSYFIEYRDNFNNYFSAMKEVLKGEKKYKFWVEIFCVYPLYSFVCFMDITFEIFIIYYLNPFYVLLANNLYYGVAEIISFLLYLSNNSFRITQYVIAQSSEVFVSLGNMVYLEIVELHCCGLNDNTKRRLMEKAEKEFRILSDINSIQNDNYEKDDEDAEKENEISVYESPYRNI